MKYSVWVLYFGCAAAIFFASGWIHAVGHLLLWLTLAAHVVEFFVKKSVMEQAGGSMGGHFLQTLIYGLFHWKPLEEKQAAGAAVGREAGRPRRL